MSIEYVYVLQVREFVRLREKVYKIGRTSKPNLGRLNDYPSGSVLYMQIQCNDSITIERAIINSFKQKYILRRDYGYEYFEGDINSMIDDIHYITKCYRDTVNNSESKHYSESESESESDTELESNSESNTASVITSNFVDGKHRCEICEKSFKRVYELERHKNRKKKCQYIIVEQSNVSPLNVSPLNVSPLNVSQVNANIPLNNSISDEENANILNVNVNDISNNELECKYCHKTYSRSDNLKRHMLKYCNIKNMQTKLQTIVQQERKETDKKIEELQNTITDLQSKIKTETTNIINNNNTINITNNIIIFKFGSKIDHNLITTEKLVHFLNQGVNKTISLMVEEIHCNINHPQYHNVYIADKRSNDAIIYDGNQYKTVYLNETIDELYSNMKTYITDRFYRIEGLEIDQERFNSNFTEDEKTNIVKQLKKLNDVDEDSSDYKMSYRLIKYILCDYRETIKDTRRKIEKKQKRRLASTETLNLEGVN